MYHGREYNVVKLNTQIVNEATSIILTKNVLFILGVSNFKVSEGHNCIHDSSGGPHLIGQFLLNYEKIRIGI